MSIWASVALTASWPCFSTGTYTDQNCPPTPPDFSRGMSVINVGWFVLRSSFLTSLPAFSRKASGRSLCPSMMGLSFRSRRARSRRGSFWAALEAPNRARTPNIAAVLNIAWDYGL